MKEFGTILENNFFKSTLIILGIFLAAYIIYKILDFLLLRIGKKLVARTKTEIDDKILDFLEKFLKRIVIFIALLLAGIELSKMVSEQVYFFYERFLYVLIVYIIAWLVTKILLISIDWYLMRIADQTGSEVHRDFGPLIKRIVQITVWLIVLLIVFDEFGIDAKGLLATLGVGSLAIAFAAQDTLANMISGFVIMVDRPFRVGDRIKTPDGTLGEVFEIGLRTTKLLDFERNLHIIPNLEIAKSTVINYSYPNKITRVTIKVGVAYGTDLKKVKQIILNIFEAHENILDDPAPNVFFTNFGDSSLDLLCIGFVSHYTMAWTTGEEIRMQINDEFKKNNIEIPFPQRTVWMQQMGKKED